MVNHTRSLALSILLFGGLCCGAAGAGPLKAHSMFAKDPPAAMAHAAYPLKMDAGIWNAVNKNCDTIKIHVWSPLVKEPVAVRYAWARSPLGNLKVGGKPWQPLQSFRSDAWDWPESDDPAAEALDRATMQEMAHDAARRCEFRQMEEARLAVEILKRRAEPGKMPAGAR